MITQTVLASETDCTLDMCGVDFRDMVVERRDGNILRLTFTPTAYKLVKEAFEKGKASVSTSTTKTSEKVEETTPVVSEKVVKATTESKKGNVSKSNKKK